MSAAFRGCEASAFPLTSDPSDDARDKTLKFWTAQDLRNCDYLDERRHVLAEMLDEAGARTLGELVGREGLRS